MEPSALIDLGTSPSRRSLAGHIFALSVYVFIFGALSYLAFLKQGGIPGQLLLVYVSAWPLGIAIGTVVEIARARQKFAAHHVVAGCLNAVLLCGIGGIWVVFREQILLTFIGSLALVWLTKYSAGAELLKPPNLSDVASSTPVLKNRSVRTVATLAGALALMVLGVGLTGLALVSQMERPGVFSITIGT